MKSKILLILLFSFFNNFVQADSVGKLFNLGFGGGKKLRLVDKNGKLLRVDSIILVFPDSKVTAQLNPSDGGPWEEKALAKLHGEFRFYNLDNFVVFAFLNSKIYHSSLITQLSGHEVFEFELRNNELHDISNIFHEKWYVYIIALIVTLIVELGFGFKYIENQNVHLFFISCLMVNLITHFSAWYLHTNSIEPLPMAFLEFAIIIIESIYWKFFLKCVYHHALKISFVLNFLSWLIGGIISSIF